MNLSMLYNKTLKYPFPYKWAQLNTISHPTTNSFVQINLVPFKHGKNMKLSPKHTLRPP